MSSGNTKVTFKFEFKVCFVNIFRTPRNEKFRHISVLRISGMHRRFVMTLTDIYCKHDFQIFLFRLKMQHSLKTANFMLKILHCISFQFNERVIKKDGINTRVQRKVHVNYIFRWRIKLFYLHYRELKLLIKITITN